MIKLDTQNQKIEDLFLRSKRKLEILKESNKPEVSERVNKNKYNSKSFLQRSGSKNNENVSTKELKTPILKNTTKINDDTFELKKNENFHLTDQVFQSINLLKMQSKAITDQTMSQVHFFHDVQDYQIDRELKRMEKLSGFYFNNFKKNLKETTQLMNTTVEANQEQFTKQIKINNNLNKLFHLQQNNLNQRSQGHITDTQPTPKVTLQSAYESEIKQPPISDPQTVEEKEKIFGKHDYQQSAKSKYIPEHSQPYFKFNKKKQSEHQNFLNDDNLVEIEELDVPVKKKLKKSNLDYIMEEDITSKMLWSPLDNFFEKQQKKTDLNNLNETEKLNLNDSRVKKYNEDYNKHVNKSNYFKKNQELKLKLKKLENESFDLLKGRMGEDDFVNDSRYNFEEFLSRQEYSINLDEHHPNVNHFEETARNPLKNVSLNNSASKLKNERQKTEKRKLEMKFTKPELKEKLKSSILNQNVFQKPQKAVTILTRYDPKTRGNKMQGALPKPISDYKEKETIFLRKTNVRPPTFQRKTPSIQLKKTSETQTKTSPAYLNYIPRVLYSPEKSSYEKNIEQQENDKLFYLKKKKKEEEKLNSENYEDVKMDEPINLFSDEKSKKPENFAQLMDRYCQTLPEVNNAKTQTLSDDEVLPKIVSSSKENVEVKQSPVVKIDKKDVSAQYSEPKEKNIIMKDTSIQYSSQSNTSSILQSYDINEDILFEVNSKKKKMSWKKSEEKRFHDTTEIEDIANLSRIKGANFPSSKIGSELGEWVKHEVMQRILQKSFATTTVESKNIPENKVSDETLGNKEEITQVENNVKKIDFDQVTEKPEKIKDDLYSGEISNEILNEMLSDLIDFEGRVLLQEIREQREQALKKELEVSTIKENEIKSILEKKDLELAAAKKQFENEIVKFKTSMEKEFEKKTVDIEKNKDIEFEIKNLKLNFEKVEIEKKELIEKLNFEKMLKEKELKELEEKKKLEIEELEKRRHYEMQQYEEKKNLEIAEKKKLKNLAKLKDAKLKELQDLEIEKVEMDNKKKKKLEEEELRQANVAKEEELRRQNLEKLKAELETVEAKRKKLESELDNFLINRDKEILFASKDDLASSVFVEEGSKKSSLEESKSKINSSSSYGIDLTDMSSFSQGELLTQIFSEGEVVEKINFKDFEKLLKKKAQFPEEEKNIGASSKEKKFFEDIGEKESYYSFGEVSSEEKGVHKNISKVKVQQQVFHQENSGSGSGSGGATTSSGETSSLGEITNAELIHNFSILSTGEVSEIKRFGYILKKGSLGEINIYSEDESERLEHISLKAEEKKKKVTIKGKEKMESETQNDKSKVEIPQENVERKKDEVGKIPLVENVSNLQMIESHRKIEKQATQNLSNQLAKADEASYLNPTLESESNDNKFSAEDIVPLDSTSKIFSGERENSEIEHKRNDYNIQTKKQDDELKDSNALDGSNFEAMSKKVEEQSEVRDKENSTEEFDKSVESEIKSLGNVAEKVLDICSSSENVSIGKYSTLSKSKSLISISSVTSSVDGDEDKKIEEMLKISSSIRKNLSHLLSSNATSTSSSSVNYEHFKLNKEANTGDSASSSLKKDVIKKSSINYLPDPKKVIELLESESLSSIISDNASKSRDDNISKVFDVETSLLDDDVSTSSKHSLYKGENKVAAAIKEDNNEKSNSSANNDDLEKSSIEESIPSRAAAFSEIEIPSKSADDRNSKSSASSIISEILQSKNSSKSSGTGSSPKYSSEVFEMNKSEGNDGEGTNKSNYSDVYETSDQ